MYQYAMINNAGTPTSEYLTTNISNVFLPSALLILIVFYSIYFIKMFAQKRQGIQTYQLGQRCEKSIRNTEILLKLSTGMIIPVQICSILFNCSTLPALARITGIFIGAAGDFIFLIAILTMKNSWRAGIPKKDKTELISHGIYKYSRNPAFLGFDFMYIGILLLYLNLVLLILTLLTILTLHLQILQEEKYLENIFGEQYITYKKCTHRYFGKNII